MSSNKYNNNFRNMTLLLIVIGIMSLLGGSNAFLFQQRKHHNGMIYSSGTTTMTTFLERSIPSTKLMMEVNQKNDDNDNNNDENKKSIWNGIRNLWDEIIEVSTYGPSERKILKAQREQQQKLSLLSLEEKKQTNHLKSQNTDDNDDDQAWIEAFTAARDNQNDDDNNTSLEYDGYALQELLVSKYGVSLDIDFQRIGDCIYCTILPMIGYGGSSSLRSRHMTELDYLMHLQGVVEILHKYENLNDFIAFVETTNKVPKRGTDSVPFRLTLSQNDLDKIMP